MEQKGLAVPKGSGENQKECSHYWVVESPAGRTSRGVCLICGAEKEFKNYLRDCLGTGEEGFRQWRAKAGYGAERENPDEAVPAQFRGADKDAVKAGR